MKRRLLTHKDLVRWFLILPTQLVFVLCMLTFLVSDLYLTLHCEVRHIERINQLLARDVASSHAPLHQRQIENLLQLFPEIENAAFFATPANVAIPKSNNRAHPLAILFNDYMSFNQPVVLSSNHDQTQAQQVYGYVNTTLNLTRIRQQWLHNIWLPCLVMLVLDGLLMWYILRLAKRMTEHLPAIEKISKQVLADKPVDLSRYASLQEDSSALLIERTLLHSLHRQARLQAELQQLKTDTQALKQQQLAQMQQFSSFQNLLTHEFKTAIGHVNTGLELLQSHYLTEEQQDAVNVIGMSMQTVNSKLDQIIQLIRIERGQTGVDLAYFNPNQLLEEVIANYQPFAEQKGLTLTLKTYHADYRLEGDAGKITTIVSSFVDNAIKFTEQGKVLVSSQLQHFEHRIRWTLQIQDTGVGITQKHIDQLFDPFFEADPAPIVLHHPYSNALFLVKKLADLIGASIEVSSKLGQGTTVIVSMVLLDWQNRDERKLLQGYQLALWLSDHLNNLAANYLIGLGAQVAVYEQPRNLLDQLLQQPFDALLICPSIEFEHANALLSQLRRQQTNRRILVIYYYHKLTARQIELLQINGIDHLQAVGTDVSNAELRQLVQHLASYLL